MLPRPNHIDKYVEKLPNKSKYIEYEFSLLDAKFDNNDVTWCRVFVYGIKSNRVYKIVDD